jgi:ferritin-like metal-binding protein YciE
VAEAGGFGGATTALQANLSEEKAMAQWLDENIVTVTAARKLRWAIAIPFRHRRT